ncbi:MAG: tRNA pseudouridine(55) synthase TruB [Lactovum sp.]
MNGILNVYKESGWTSNDVVQKLRGILKTKKVGHGGTLDPAVTGVLPIAVGKATRLLEYMETSGKVYEGEITLGFSTETEDAQGDIVKIKKIEKRISEEEVDLFMSYFLGKILQVPPMYSAVKVNGRKLYEYARAGQEVERPVREVEIKEFSRTSELKYEGGLLKFNFRVACSKGTYIRTLAVDLAKSLGYPGHMSQLTRTMANGLLIKDSKTLKEIEDFRDKEQLESLFLPLKFAVEEMETVHLTKEQFEDIRVGRRISNDKSIKNGLVAIFYDQALIGICSVEKEELKAKKILV